MLPDNYRLKKRRDFSRIYARGRHDACSAFILYCLPRRGSTEVHIGFSASKKLGHAVERNRIKRVFRHVAASLLELFPPGCDYIFVIRGAALEQSFERISRQMAKMLRSSPAVPGHNSKPQGCAKKQARNSSTVQAQAHGGTSDQQA